jgi:hypothetical protein
MSRSRLAAQPAGDVAHLERTQTDGDQIADDPGALSRPERAVGEHRCELSLQDREQVLGGLEPQPPGDERRFHGFHAGGSTPPAACGLALGGSLALGIGVRHVGRLSRGHARARRNRAVNRWRS